MSSVIWDVTGPAGRPESPLTTVIRIEENILALHDRKRELDENLPSGGDTAGRVSTDDLIRPLQGNEQS